MIKELTDRQIQAKLNQMVKIGNELVAEAERRYGPQGNLFFEAEGSFHIMSGDCERSCDRQGYIEFSSHGHSRMGAGAW